jgi:hypothetical protein
MISRARGRAPARRDWSVHLRLANLPNFALDRLSRYEGTLWRQAGQILYALAALDRPKPQERRRCYVSSPQDLADFERE